MYLLLHSGQVNSCTTELWSHMVEINWNGLWVTPESWRLRGIQLPEKYKQNLDIFYQRPLEVNSPYWSSPLSILIVCSHRTCRPIVSSTANVIQANVMHVGSAKCHVSQSECHESCAKCHASQSECLISIKQSRMPCKHVSNYGTQTLLVNFGIFDGDHTL
jgi:hypothetical protein